jgi:hypothetical protein
MSGIRSLGQNDPVKRITRQVFHNLQIGRDGSLNCVAKVLRA